MTFKLVSKKFSGTALFWVAVCLVFILSPVLLAAQAKDQVNPFYDKLLEAGKYFYQQSNYESAVENIGIAFFGYLDHPEKLLECYVYLEVCHYLLKNTEKSKFYDDEIKRLNLRSNLDDLKLPSGLRDRFLEINAYFSQLEGKAAGDTASGQVTKPISTGSPAAGAQPLAQRQTTPSPSSTADPSAEIDQQIKNLKAVIKSSPTNQDTYFRLSAVYLDQKKYKDARRVLENLLSVDPKNGRAYKELGEVYIADKAYLKAVAALTRGLKYDPVAVELRFLLGTAYMGAKKYAEAGDEFDIVLAGDPNDKNARALRQTCQEKLKK